MSRVEKQLVVFDVDGTLTESRSVIEPDLARTLCRLLEKYTVGIISGGEFKNLKERVADHLPCSNLNSLFILPTSGSDLYVFNNTAWQAVYRGILPKEDREHIIQKMNEVLDTVEKDPPHEIFGERIEDRETQITFSGLGQDAPLELKEAWDPKEKRREEIQSALQKELPGYEIAIGGTTSIDITKKGHDKGYGIKQLIDYLHTPLNNVLFIGDKLAPGGNDYPARTLCINYKEVESPRETQLLIKQLFV